MITRNILTAVVVLGIVGSANAFVSWTSPSGSGAFFDYSNGGSDNGLFGDPVGPIGQTFVFAPSNFTAPDGSSDTAYDRIEVDLTETSGDITFIRFIESGSYEITGGGSVLAQATQVHSYDLFNPVQDVFTFDSAGDASGNWSLETIIPVPTGVSSFTLVFENRLQATGNATITKDSLDIDLPEPATLSLLALAGLLLRRR